MTEAERDCIQLLDSFGPRLLWHHDPDSRILNGPPGMPDFIVIGRRGILWREVKPHAASQLKPAQVAWRYMLQAAGADYAVWTQADLDSGRVEREVEAIL